MTLSATLSTYSLSGSEAYERVQSAGGLCRCRELTLVCSLLVSGDTFNVLDFLFKKIKNK